MTSERPTTERHSGPHSTREPPQAPPAPPPAATLRLTLFPALKATTGRPVDWSWPTMIQLLTDPPAPLRAKVKDKLPLLKMGRYVGNSRAAGSPLEAITGAEGDYDDGLITPQQAALALAGAGIRCLVVTTPSHTPERPRWRVFAPTSIPLIPHARHQLVKRLNGVLDGALAAESFTLARAFYVGCLDPVSGYACLPVEGECVDLMPELDAAAAGPAQRDGAGAPDTETDADRAFRLSAAAAAWRDGLADEARDALMACDPDCDYGQWSQLGAAVYTASGGQGFDLFDEWSARSPKYPGSAAVAAKFADFGRMTQIGYGKLLWVASRLYGWKLAESRKAAKAARDAAAKATQRMQDANAPLPTPTAQLVTLSDALKNWVYVAEGEQVVLLDRDNLTLSLSACGNAFAASQMLVDSGGKTMRAKRVPVFEQWAMHPERKTHARMTHAPGQPRVCADPDGVDCLNLWTPTPRKEMPLALAEHFVAHVAYLTNGDTVAFTRFMQWLAHIEQRPGEAVQAHYLMATEAEGIGRGWLSRVLSLVWHRQVAQNVNLQGIISSGFNGAIAGKLLAVVDEIDVGGNDADKSKFTTSLKDMLTATTRLVNPKYGRQRVEWAATRWLLCSNSRNPVPMSATDRRLNVIQNPSDPRGAAYYTTMFARLADPDFIAAVAWYLHTLDLGEFNPGERAAWSESKADVISSGVNGIVASIQTLATEWPGDAVTADQLRAHIVGQTGVKRETLYNFSKYLAPAGVRMYPPRVYREGTRMNVVILRNYEAWRNAIPAAVNEEIDRGLRLHEEENKSRNQHTFG